MSLFQAILLGVIQGLTEFLPISSSAHLVLVPAILGWTFSESISFIFGVLVQWGTLSAVLVYYWKDLFPIGLAMLKSLRTKRFDNPQARLGWLLILGTLPAIIVGWLIRDEIQSAFVSKTSTGLFLLGTGVLLVLAELIGNRKLLIKHIEKREALIIGIFQAFSLFPGISRSGATIAGGMAINLKRESAARFSFLLAVPVMIAAGSIALLDLNSMPSGGDLLQALLMGFLVSAILGYISIHWLIKYLSSHSLYPFAIYCFVIGTLAISLG